MPYRLAYRRYRLPFRATVRTAHGIWAEREGVIVRLEAEGGGVGWGEAAPLAGFGTESADEAEAACQRLGDNFDAAMLASLPRRLLCLRSALATALCELEGPVAPRPEGGSSRPVAALLPAGRAALPQIRPKAEAGFRTFKWKVGAANFADELVLLDDVCAALPSGARLRLDANGAWDRHRAELWLERSAERPVEFIEQPIAAEVRGADDLLLGLAADYPTPIGLDESLLGGEAIDRWLDLGWPGIFVLKPSLLGDAQEPLERLGKRARDRVVFSSALETAIGARAALRMAFGWPDEARALGFGVWPLFVDRRFDGPPQRPLYPGGRRRSDLTGGAMDRLELARLLGAPVGGAGPESAPVVIEERDPVRFMAALAAAVVGAGPVFLADPAWGATDRAALADCLKQPAAGPAGRGWLMIPSGGTSGRLKFARHDEGTLAAAVHGFCAHFGVARASCVGVLPLHHVSGLMAWMRAALTGGEYIPWDWKRLEAGEVPPLPRDGEGCFLSLVPTQLQRLLAKEEVAAWLQEFQAVFIGGGPVWPELADAAARAGLPLSLSYGMTETAAMAAALRPAEFLLGARNSGSPLPHLRLTLTEGGLVRAAGSSVFRGYYPDWSDAGEFVTDDLGQFDAEGRLEILGRRDALIITGGEKADPLEIERALRASGEFADVAVVGVADPAWGEVVVACYPGSQPAPNDARVAAQAPGAGPLQAAPPLPGTR